MVQETAKVGEAYGVETGNYAAFPPIRTYVDQPVEETVAQFAANAKNISIDGETELTYPSMTQDLLAGRRIEVDEVFGDIVARAHRAGVPVPRLEIVSTLISGLNLP